MTANYSPKLKEATARITAILSEGARITAILSEADIAGYVVLHEPGFEYRLQIEPRWSVLRMIGEEGIRRHSKLEDYGGDRERQHREIEATAKLLRHLADLLPQHAQAFDALHAVEHTEAVHTPHRPH